MLISRIYLRNFRVYEDELDLEIPPGLVGIHGPNGAGKSTLLEAILFTLWGKARTGRDQIRSSGVGGECVTEVEFEHEGHLYLVRRSLKGLNSAVSAEVHCDGALMSSGIRDAERYVESILGMDDLAFRASVFTEQKQLAAFSNQSPADRRKLVLQLLGITPLDGARDAARKDARELTAAHDRARAMLPDLDAAETAAADAAARAAASEVTATEEEAAAGAARQRAAVAEEAYAASDRRRQAHDGLVTEGRSVRSEMDAAQRTLEQSAAELAELDRMAEALARAEEETAGLAADEKLLDAVSRAAEAAGRAEAVVVPAAPPAPDIEATESAVARASRTAQEVAALAALVEAAEGDVKRAGRAVELSKSLSGEAACPTCGQALGRAFETVQSHRAAERAEAEQRRGDLTARLERTRADAAAAAREAAAATELTRAAQKRTEEWESARRRREDADRQAAEAWEAALADGAARLLPTAGPDGGEPGGRPARIAARELSDVAGRLRNRVRAGREAAALAQQMRGRLEGRPAQQRLHDDARLTVESAASRVEVLREKVRALGFRPEELEAARAERDLLTAEARAAEERSRQASLSAARERERASAATDALTSARAQHDKLADLQSEARHTARAADLLSEFRNTVVGTVGPRLALQAAELFGELTDHEYEGIEVDPDTYGLQISDGGKLYGLDRFSGSEIDLANLALRVAISEHIHFQSGGSVGLLVLDEVFGPLDEDRKTRMLLALERLKGRFRQVLVVTHDNEIKEQLPHAIEVLKLPGRRATARVVGD